MILNEIVNLTSRCTYLYPSAILKNIVYLILSSYGWKHMEYDRFRHNNKLYVIGIISLISALSLLFFSLFIVPFLIWNLNYDVPDIITALITFFEEHYDFRPGPSKFLTWLIFFVPSIVAGYISYYVSNHIDDQIYKLNNPSTTETQDEKIATEQSHREWLESANLGFKIIGLMIIIVVAILLLQLLVQLTTN